MYGYGVSHLAAIREIVLQRPKDMPDEGIAGSEQSYDLDVQPQP